MCCACNQSQRVFLCRAASLGGSASTVVSSPQQQQSLIPFDKLDPTEIKDLLICFLYIVKNLSEGGLGFWYYRSKRRAVLVTSRNLSD